jgi:hypothetical protein
MNADEYRGLTPEQALDAACEWATTARRLARKADEQLAEAISRYNRAGGDNPLCD